MHGILNIKNCLMNNKKILYISDVNAREPIFHSQVIPHISELEKEYKVDLIVLSRGEEGSSYDYSYISHAGDYSIPFSILVYIKNKKQLYKYLDQGKYDIILSRGFRGGLVGAFVKQYYFKNNIKLINDVRADVLDEHKESLVKKWIFKRTVRYVFKKSDSIFFVSFYLKNKYCRLFKFQGSTEVCPTFVPDNKFTFSEDIRFAYRSKLGFLKDDIVLLYSGNLAKWQNVDLILESFEKTTNKNLKLLFLTRDEGIYEKINHFDKKNLITIKSVDYEEIQNYYFASDYGLLIRDNIDTNKSASPTKFSEYVNSGLALIINQIDADYVRVFQMKNLKGKLLKNKYDLSSYLDQIELSDIERNNISINTLSEIVSRQMRILNF